MPVAKFSDAQRIIRAGQQAFRDKLAAQDKSSAARLKQAYQKTLGALTKRLKEFQAIAAEKGMTARQLADEAATIRLRDSMRQELKDLSAAINREARNAESASIAGSRQIAALNMRAAGLEGGFNQPSIESIRALAGYVDKPAFKQVIENFAPFHADNVGNLILAGAAKGQNPLAVARMVTQYVEGFPRADAERMVRTVSLWSARQGTLEIYRANADVVQGWIWSASIGDPRTCESCICMHGTVHDLSDTLDDHHNGRCAPVPMTASWADLGFSGGKDLPEVQTGIDWLKAQNEATQRAVLGNAKWQAWQDGAFRLEQIPTVYQDNIYGTMRRASSLTELVGPDAAKAYTRGKAA